MCWVCRVAIWAAIAAILLKLAAGAAVVGGLIVVIAEFFGVSQTVIAGLLGSLVGLSLVDAVDWVCCKIGGVCC